jgi:hypothetical protein
MSELADVTSSSVGQSGGKRLVPRWLAVFLCRLGWTKHPDADEWRRAGYRLRKMFLEDWAARSR